MGNHPYFIYELMNGLIFIVFNNIYLIMRLTSMTLINRVISILFISFLTSSVVMAGETTPDSIAGTTKVTAEELIELVGKHDDMVIIDARKPSDRDKGYIEGSIGLPNTDTTPASLAKHIKTKTTPVCFFCNGVKCGRSVESSKVAVKDGYTNVYWFRGGWAEWEEKGLPVTKD